MTEVGATPRSGGVLGRIRVPAVLAAMLLVVAVGCTGENIFTAPALTTRIFGPAVEITSPTSGTSVAVGNALDVTAQASSVDGITQVSFVGTFTAGGTAFTAQTIPLGTTTDTTLTVTMQQPGTTTGSVSIIVTATDVLGQQGSDTVAVTIE